MTTPYTDADQQRIDALIDQAPTPDLDTALPRLMAADPDGTRAAEYLHTHLAQPAHADPDHLAFAALVARTHEHQHLTGTLPQLSDPDLAQVLRTGPRWATTIATTTAIDRLAEQLAPETFEALLEAEDLTSALAKALDTTAPETPTAPADPTDSMEDTA